MANITYVTLMMNLNLAPVRWAITLFAVTTLVIGVGLLVVRTCGSGAIWRSFALRCLMGITLASIAISVIAQVLWNPNRAVPSPITISSSSESAKWVTAVMHDPGDQYNEGPLFPKSNVQGPDLWYLKNSEQKQDPILHSLQPKFIQSMHISHGENPLQVALGNLSWSYFDIVRRVGLTGFVLIFWLLAVCIMLSRIIAGTIIVHKIMAASTLINHNLESVRCAFEKSHMDPLNVRLLQSEDVGSPFATGLFSNTIVIPATLVQRDIDFNEMESVLIHELSHIQRRDPLFALVSQLLCAFLWFQPLTWVLARKLEDAAEYAADASVLASGTDGKTYAILLCEVAAKRLNRLTESVAGIGMVPSRSRLGRRINIILSGMDVSVKFDNRWRWILGAAYGVVLLAVGFCMALRYVPKVSGELSSATINYAPIWQPNGTDLAHFKLAWKNGWATVPAERQNPAPRIMLVKHKNGRWYLPQTPASPIPAEIAPYLSSIEELSGPTQYRKPTNDRRDAFLHQITEHPGFFYPEYLLGNWYRLNGNDELANHWISKSLADAPAIVAFRLQNPDGTPANVDGFRVCFNLESAIQIRPGGGTSIPNLNYYQLASDSDGCVYLPMFKHTYGPFGGGCWISSGSTNKFVIMTSTLGSLQFPEKISVLPPVTIRPYIALSIDGVPLNHNSGYFGLGNLASAKAIRGQQLHLEWQRVAGAGSYVLTVRQWIGKTKAGLSDSYVLQREIVPTAGSMAIGCALDLRGSNPVFYSNGLYELSVQASSKTNPILDESHEFCFTVPGNPASLTEPVSATRSKRMLGSTRLSLMIR
jgi:beta-lactamase regulating signal transducer with metallopeptidase domain